MSRRKTLGQLIKQKRQELALTQRELAKRLGVEASHVAYLEGGKRNPSLSLMARLEDALGVSRQEIFLLTHPDAASVVNANHRGPQREPRADDWRKLVTDRAFVKRHRITPRELRAFKELSLLGYILSRHQLLAILTMIREPQDS